MIYALLTGLIVAPGFWVKVDGPGYLRLMDAGRIVAAKEATLAVAGGEVRDQQGRALAPSIRTGADAIEVTESGEVIGVTAQSRVVVGRLILAVYPVGSVPERRGNVLCFAERPTLVQAGDAAGGLIAIRNSSGDPKPTPSSTVKPATDRPRLVFKSEVETDKSVVTLGDLATIEGPQAVVAQLSAIPIVDTPPFRTRASVSRLTLERKLQQAGVASTDVEFVVSGTVFVKRSSRTMSGEALIADAKRVVAERGTPAEALVVDGAVGDLELPTGEIRVESNVYENALAFSVQLAYVQAGVRVGTRTVRLKAVAEAVGVLRNETVKLVLRSSGAMVEIAAKASSDGLIGNEVSVRLDSGKTHRGTVVGRGIVEVRL